MKTYVEFLKEVYSLTGFSKEDKLGLPIGTGKRMDNYYTNNYSYKKKIGTLKGHEVWEHGLTSTYGDKAFSLYHPKENKTHIIVTGSDSKKMVYSK